MKAISYEQQCNFSFPDYVLSTTDICFSTNQPSADTDKEPFHPTTRTFLYNEAYGSSDTDWADKTKSVRTTNLGGYTIPYIYLHAASDKVSSSKSVDSTNNAYHYVTLTGGIWDDRILPNAEATLKADGYTTDTSTLRNQHESLEAYKKNTDGSYLRVLLYKDGTDSKTAKAQLVIYYDAALTITDTKTDWSEDIKKVYSGKLYNSVPYFYRGEYLTAKRTENDNPPRPISPSRPTKPNKPMVNTTTSTTISIISSMQRKPSKQLDGLSKRGTGLTVLQMVAMDTPPSLHKSRTQMDP